MQNNSDNQVYAGFCVRLAAYIVDCIIVGIVLLVAKIPFAISNLFIPDNIMVRDFIFSYSISDIIFYLLKVGYFILLTYYSGATIGKKLFSLRVISVEERKMTFFEVAYRETVGRFLSGLIVCVGYILVALDKQKRGLHDLISDTCVVYYHEKRVYTRPPVTYTNMHTGNPVAAPAPQNYPSELANSENEDVQ